MAEEIAFENGRISNFQGLMTLTLDRVILHIVVHHSSTSTYMPNFIQIEGTFCGRTDGRTPGRTDEHLRFTLLGRLRRDFTIFHILRYNRPTGVWRTDGRTDGRTPRCSIHLASVASYRKTNHVWVNETLLRCTYACSAKRNVTVCRPSVRLSVRPYRVLRLAL